MCLRLILKVGGGRIRENERDWSMPLGGRPYQGGAPAPTLWQMGPSFQAVAPVVF